jgi:NAD-dependent dihydropyrimidine dehydrogenase PreA subunit
MIRPNLFIAVDVAPAVAGNPQLAATLEEVCPVDIFGRHDDGTLAVHAERLDECVLCDLCAQACPPGGVVVRRLY